jgi:hypothetical protein
MGLHPLAGSEQLEMADAVELIYVSLRLDVRYSDDLDPFLKLEPAVALSVKFNSEGWSSTSAAAATGSMIHNRDVCAVATPARWACQCLDNKRIAKRTRY